MNEAPGPVEGRGTSKAIPIMNELVQMARGPVPTGDGGLTTDLCLLPLPSPVFPLPSPPLKRSFHQKRTHALEHLARF